MNATVMTLATYYALKEVEASIVRDEGYRGLRGLEIAELKTRAMAFLDKHPEIIARAAKTVRNDPALRRMAERHGSLL
jgi:hypothetical protein